MTLIKLGDRMARSIILLAKLIDRPRSTNTNEIISMLFYSFFNRTFSYGVLFSGFFFLHFFDDLPENPNHKTIVTAKPKWLFNNGK